VGQGSVRNIEEIVRSKGHQLTRGRLDAGGSIEYAEYGNAMNGMTEVPAISSLR